MARKPQLKPGDSLIRVCITLLMTLLVMSFINAYFLFDNSGKMTLVIKQAVANATSSKLNISRINSLAERIHNDGPNTWRIDDMVAWCREMKKENKDFICVDPYKIKEQTSTPEYKEKDNDDIRKN